MSTPNSYVEALISNGAKFGDRILEVFKIE